MPVNDSLLNPQNHALLKTTSGLPNLPSDWGFTVNVRGSGQGHGRCFMNLLVRHGRQRIWVFAQ